MISHFGGKSFLRLATAFALIAATPICLAAPTASAGARASNNLDKHARKIHRELSRFKPGSYVHLVFRDDSQRTGALDSLNDTSVTVTNAENNARESHDYSDIARVTREKDYIGEGSEGRGHHVRLWIPVTVGVLTAGAVATALLVR